MKKLKLSLQNIEGAEVLTREQLKKVMGGNSMMSGCSVSVTCEGGETKSCNCQQGTCSSGSNYVTCKCDTNDSGSTGVNVTLTCSSSGGSGS